MREEDEGYKAQTKSLLKKLLGMHDKQEHPGKKTDLSKLKEAVWPA